MNSFNIKRRYILFLVFIKSSFFYSQNLPIVGFDDTTNYRIATYDVPGSSGLDLHWHGGIRFGDRTGNNIMQITNGNIGIGTITPRAYFDMAQYINNGQIGTVFGRLGEGDNTGNGTFLGVQGYVTQGENWQNVKSFSIIHNFYGTTNSSINFYRGSSITGGFMTFCTDNNIEKMRIGINGYVGIGTTTPTSMLTVAGNIASREVKVTVNAGADFVFENNYNLPSLESVDKFIQENKHLPEIASADEMKKDGINLSEMNIKLLQKIEELTLYSIQQNKKIATQEKKIEELEKENNAFKILSERLSKIEQQLNNQLCK